MVCLNAAPTSKPKIMAWSVAALGALLSVLLFGHGSQHRDCISLQLDRALHFEVSCAKESLTAGAKPRIQCPLIQCPL